MSVATTAGLYLHVPFCLKKCDYCSFYSIARNHQVDGWAKALECHIGQLHSSCLLEGVRFNTIFFGGGTPTALPLAMLIRLLKLCTQTFEIGEAGIETSIEVNPATVSAEELNGLRLAGFNRISIGVQSFVDTELLRLGRVHSAAAAVETFEAARQAGFDNLSLDLMYGLPGQDNKSWLASLEKALALKPDHLSLYELTPEPGSRLYEQLNDGRMALPDEETVLAMMEDTGRLIAASALERYEISNYARPGRQCVHNLNYWANGAYLGLGPGAVSCLQGRRIQTITDIRAFCERVHGGQTVWVEEEQLDREALFRETVVMGLRMIRGSSSAKLQRRFGLDISEYYGDVLVRLLDQGLLEWEGGYLRLTTMGLPLANSVMAQLV